MQCRWDLEKLIKERRTVQEDLYSAIDQDNADEVDRLVKLFHQVKLNDFLETYIDRVDRVLRVRMPPLIYAIKNKAIAATRTLLDNGASTKGKNYKHGTPPIHYAVGTKMVEIVKLLLDYGAEVDSLNVSQVTALILACRTGELRMVQLLLDRGANINHVTQFEDRYGQRMPFDYANGEFLERLAEPCRYNSPLIEACRLRHINIAKVLLDRGADINLVTTPGKTALLIASFCMTSQPWLLKLADQDKYSIMPTSPPILKLLIERGAYVTVLNNFDETAAESVLHHICIISRYEQITKYVVETLQYFYINFCLLVKAGCPLSPMFEINLDTHAQNGDRHVFKTLLILSEAYAAANKVESSVPLDEAYTSAMTVALLSGLKPGKEDITFVEGHLQDSKTKECILSLLKRVAGEGYTLRQLCQMRLREMARRPLFTNIMSVDFKLPVFLKECILLDCDVPTANWIDNNYDSTNYPGYV